MHMNVQDDCLKLLTIFTVTYCSSFLGFQAGLSINIFFSRAWGPCLINSQGPQANFGRTTFRNTSQFWGGPLGPQVKFNEGLLDFQGPKLQALESPVLCNVYRGFYQLPNMVCMVLVDAVHHEINFIDQ